MQRFTLLLIGLFFTIFSAEAQALRGVCGNTYEDQLSQMDRYMANLKTVKSQSSKSRNAITYIPIQFNIVTQNNGFGGAKILEVLEQQCLLNEQFGAFDIIFYQPEIPFVIANDVIYSNHTSTSAQFTMRQRRNPMAMNIWIVDDATGSGAIDGGITLGYWDRTNDWIVVRKDRVSSDNSGTLAHEIGHFFSLMHPHLGWESEPYSVATHGNPVSATAPDGRETELVNGGNCETTGDFLCDTPPDYNFGFTSANCNYSGAVKDPNGDLVNPDESLTMSYFRDECLTSFSPMQVDMMIADVNSAKRNFLTRNNFTPIAMVITEETTLIAPIDSEVTSSFNKVKLEWTAVEGANRYFVEVDRSSTFTQDNFKYIVNTNSILLEDVLDANKNYRWRVTPYNEAFTCVPTSPVARFKTSLSTSVPSIETVNNWSIQPNPLKPNDEVTLQINAKNAFSATVKIFNLTGQLLTEQIDVRIAQGSSILALDADNLTKGIYFITLENKEGILNKKLIVQ